MHHAVVLSPQSSLEAYGEAIAKLRYDALGVLLFALQNELARQAMADAVQHRPQLAELGKKTVIDLGLVIHDVQAMRKLSDSYMSEEYKIVPRLIVD